MSDNSKLAAVIKETLPDIDESTQEYFVSMISDGGIEMESLKETLAPFIESYGLAQDTSDAEKICDVLIEKINRVVLIDNKNNKVDHSEPQLLDKTILLGEATKKQISAAEQATIDNLWGFEAVRKKRNDVMETSEAGSARYERKAMKEQKKWLDELDSKFTNDEDDENNQISAMTLPDLSGNSKEKDIHVNNFDITYGGQILLEKADLRIVYGRRYGLIGRNGIGKTTLLKHMAAFDIEGFPRHHRILHVKQEVQSSSRSVLEVVLEADIERTQLLKRERELNEEIQQQTKSNAQHLQRIMDEMREVQERMELIGVRSAEARAASILSGLKFTEQMQSASTESLSGGWRMRVALAGALFIQPDLLMLDEPTNHLDLEAVLWLEEYLKSYPNSILLVSHDRAFLNEVCTDIILFANQKLTYYKGNYDMYEGTRKEMRIVQQKQHEAQQVKLQHMQDFVDKFRYNAKRASLVQSRIKAIEKETVIEEVEEEETFSFSFSDSGQLGRPIIAIEGVTFGFTEGKALFRNIHLGIDQSSRIALVGPNGCGKSTLLKLIQNKYNPWEGYIRINPQLRLGIFTQHHMDSFDLKLSPLQNMQIRWPQSNEADLRAHLGRYEITGTDALKPMKFSSGGQKSRAAFAALTFGKPHLVILDEPTNHLDMGAIDALINALKEFTGGVLAISHDQYFITQVCNEIWEIKDRYVMKFDGNFEDYKKSVISKQVKHRC